MASYESSSGLNRERTAADDLNVYCHREMIFLGFFSLLSSRSIFSTLFSLHGKASDRIGIFACISYDSLLWNGHGLQGSYNRGY
jgi:hypothetical protein